MNQPSKQFLATVFMLLATSLLGWRLFPWANVLWTEPPEPARPRQAPPTPAEAPHEPHIVERLDPQDPEFKDTEVYREHMAQYQFAKRYFQEHKVHSVADIASGTCYGMQILKAVVAVVEGYDREDLCGNYVVNLDKQDWGRKYDAIVSFETIEHLARPEFFLRNAVRSAPLLIVSAPVNEGDANPYHLQHWTTEELQNLLARFYQCEYFHRVGDVYEPEYVGGTDLFAVCKVLPPKN